MQEKSLTNKPSLHQSLKSRLTLWHSFIAVAMLLVTAGGFLSWLHPTVSAAAGFVVSNTNDSGPGSLRQAITDANNNPGLDTITFSIGSGPKTIKPAQVLPTLIDPVIIDGTTQPGFSGAPIIELNGSSLVSTGLIINGGDSTVRGLVINSFYFDGLVLGVKGGNHVEGCYIGTDLTGTFARPNGANGITTPVSNNVIGGTTPAARNVISGNMGVGIEIARPCCTGNETPITGNVIQGNYVGVNAAGNAPIPNGREGIRITSVNANVPVTGHLIGGTQAGAGNVISGNHFEGLLLDGFHVRNNTVQGNFIGTDATGSFAIPNDSTGLGVTGDNNIIGGSAPGARNVISGNGCSGPSCTTSGTGLGLNSSGNVVKGNLIGVNAALTAPLPNTGHGLAIGGSNNIIGGTAPGEANVIAFNGFNGLTDNNPSSTGNSFRGNLVFSNGFFNHVSGVSIGIDIGSSGITLNDAGDVDSGTNNLQNFPVITGVTPGLNTVNVKGTLNSAASTAFNIDFYANSICDPLGYGEGARLIGSASVTTNSSGDAAFDLDFPVTLAPGQVLTATATDPAGNTSEFSQCSQASSAGSGSVSFSAAAVSVSEAAGTASFTVERTGGSAGSLTINYAVFGQTATADMDFTPATGTLVFADGETSKTFNVPILNDTVDEVSETAKVALGTSGLLDTLGSQSTATLTITDDDPPPDISISDAAVTESDFDRPNATFQLSLSTASAKTVTVQIAASDGSATGGTDFFYPTVIFLTFLPGETSKTISLSVIGDTVVEADETFFIDLVGVTNATIAKGRGTATILNDDAVPTVSLSVNDVSVTEGNSGLTPAVVTVTLSAPTAKTVKVNYLALSGTAGAGNDFQGAANTLTFAPGQTVQTITVNVVGDTLFEGNESFSVELREPANANLTDAQGSVTIIDDESGPSLSINDITIVEGNSGKKTAVFTVSLSVKTPQQVSVSYTTTAGTATADQDYMTSFGAILFGPEQTSTTIFVDIVGDTLNESNETFFMNLSNPSGAALVKAQGQCTIIDDDSSVLQFNQGSYTVGEADGHVAIQVTRTEATREATVNYATSDAFPISQNCQTFNTGIASSRCDYATSIGTLRFAVGESSKTIFIPIVDDNLPDGNETFTIALSNPDGVSLGANSSAIINITDNANTAGNPIDQATFFIRQHYIDFLGREPEPAGLAGWLNVYNNCGTTVQQPCDRTEISSAFFRSEEFQTRAYFVYRFYSAVGKIPLYEGFMPDFAKVSGFLSAQQLEANKVAFVEEFMLRGDFQALYGTLGDPSSYVTALLNTVGLPNHPSKQSWIAALINQTMTRGQVLRALVESTEVYQKYYNEAFVIMQYFGYLRRSADISYLDWIQTMNSNGGNYRQMIDGFLNSAEYRQRFGN
jgi:hypothetical protein